MNDQGAGRSYDRDDEIVVDRDGLPHYTGQNPDLLKEYKKRVTLALARLEGSGDDEEAIALSLEKKKRRFRVKLLDGLHGRAWRRAEHFAQETAEVRADGGEWRIFEALATLDKEAIVKKGMAFDSFFKRSFRKRGTDMGEYFSNKEKLREDLQERDENTTLSDDLMAYFLLNGANLADEQKRNIVLNNNSEYNLEIFQHTLTVNFHDLHEKERRSALANTHKQKWQNRRGGKANQVEDNNSGDEDDITDDEFEEGANAADDDQEVASDAGASNDDDVFEAYSAYDAARKKLKDTQKQRGLFKGEVTFEERQEQIKEEKKRTRCGARGRIGHWAGDAACPKTGKQGDKKFGGGRGGGRGSGKPKAKPGRGGKSYFTLDGTTDEDELMEEVTSFMARGDDVSGDRDGAVEEQDSFYTDSDEEPDDERADDSYHSRDYDKDRKKSAGAASSGEAAPRPSAAPKDIPTTPDFRAWKQCELKSHLGELGLQTNGKKEILIERLEGHYSGKAQVKKGCSVSRTAAAFADGTSTRAPGENIKCADCGKYGHRGGDKLCPLYAEMQAYQQAKQRQDLEKNAKVPLTKPNISKQQTEIGAKSLGARPNAAATSSRASTSWELVNDDNTFIEQLTSPKCRRQGMQVKSNNLDGNKFYGCLNFNAITRCYATAALRAVRFDAKQGQGRGGGSTSLSQGRISRLEEPLRSRTWAAILASPDELAAVQLDPQSLALFNAGGQFTFAVGRADCTTINYDVVALVDTACALCMHSKSWRERFEKHLPPDLTCRKTDIQRKFTFASGSKQQGDVYVIPIGIGGFRGEAHSTEIPTGTTPLLISIPALDMLDGHIHMKSKKLELSALGITVPLTKIKNTTHLGIDVSQFGDDQDSVLQRMELKSSRGDAIVHLATCKGVVKDGYAYLENDDCNDEETCDTVEIDAIRRQGASSNDETGQKLEISLAARGVRKSDTRGELTSRRAQELSTTASRIAAEEKRTWATLKKEYTLAERMATSGFKKTMIFEPWGGSFIVARVASGVFGWTNSQPLDKLDDCDLMTKEGEDLLFEILDEHDPYLTITAFDCRIWSVMANMSPTVDWGTLRRTYGVRVLKLVKRICLHRYERQRYFLAEQPWSAASWKYKNILAEIYALPNVWFACGAQCGFGKKDIDSGKPIQKLTGYLTNSQCVLNKLAAPCKCQTAHEMVGGNSSAGKRAAQAAAYPPRMATAICEGVKQQMEIDSAVALANGYMESSFPVDDGVDTEPPPKRARRGAKLLGGTGGLRRRVTRKGGWLSMAKEKVDKVMEIFSSFVGFLTPLTLLWPSVDKRAAEIAKLEEASASVKLIMIRRNPRSLLTAVPHLHASQALLRTAYARSKRGVWSELGWEDWTNLSSQQRVMKIAGADLLIMVYGAQIGEAEDGEQDKETMRKQRWDQLPRDLKVAIRRLHENLGHAPKIEMLRALRISRASEAAIKACRLFSCEHCERTRRPLLAKPSKLPSVDEINVVVGFDTFAEKDADQAEWQFLNIACLDCSFQVVALLGEVHRMTGSTTVLETYELCWASWAGEPEVGVIVDRAKGFLGSFSEHMSSRGCRFDSAAKAAAWHIAKVERHGDLASHDVLKAVMEINQAKNSLSRRSGFSPAQWVLGRDSRLPADFMDDGELDERIGAIAASATPTSKFARKCALRQAAREAHAKIANEEAIKRAELRQVRPERGPFNVGDWVFYYDQKEQGKRPESVVNWRGVARVIGHEGKHTIWIVHRGITIACAPEHLARASDEEVRAWLVTAQEADLIDTTGVPQPAEREAPAEPLVQEEEPPVEEVTEDPYQEEPPMMQLGPPPPVEPRGATQAEDAVKDFVNEAVRSNQVPMGDERDPDLDDFHTPAASFPPRPAEGSASRDKESRPAEEAAERGAKRQKLLDDVPESIKTDDAFQVYEDMDSMIDEVSKEVFVFGVERNEFEYSYEAGVEAWQDLDACDTLSLGESEQIWETKRDLIILAEWVRTNKSEGVLDAEFEAKSRMVVQGFKDKSLGEYRRDAPTASKLAEAMVF
ncbi:unnamed protein product [Prorocentrum cordatum]|uniref:SAP domain-containing protein n=1 Tax=Prorocentrum cordatum TaxID=2364126 RepID=A0ABN9PIJ5_9DINO|nr:unnamed protein product [Polarella glacialis]